MKKITITPFLEARLVFMAVSLSLISDDVCSEHPGRSADLHVDSVVVFSILERTKCLLPSHVIRLSRVLYSFQNLPLPFDYTIDKEKFFCRLSHCFAPDTERDSLLSQIFARGLNNLSYALSLIPSLISQLD